MGAWAEVLPAGENAWGGDLLLLTVDSSPADRTDSSTLMDLSLFDGSTDHVIVDRLPIGYASRLKSLPLPLTVPAGVSIRARTQCATPGRTARIAAHLIGGRGLEGRPIWSGCRVVALSPLNGSRGVDHLCGAGAYSVWADLVPSVAGDFGGFLLSIQGAGDTSLSNRQRFWWQIGIGAGPELTVAHVTCVTDGSEQVFGQVGKFFPVPLANGTRVRFRGAAASTRNRTLDVSCHGVR